MNRTLKQFEMANEESRFEVTIEGDDCHPNDRIAQRNFLLACISNPGLMDCGTLSFQSLRVRHDGQKWVMQLEAVG